MTYRSKYRNIKIGKYRIKQDSNGFYVEGLVRYSETDDFPWFFPIWVSRIKWFPLNLIGEPNALCHYSRFDYPPPQWDGETIDSAKQFIKYLDGSDIKYYDRDGNLIHDTN